MEAQKNETHRTKDAQKKQRISVLGLRRSDPEILPVLTQDALRATLGRVEPATLCDLLALSELETGLGVALIRDLRQFRDQMFREISDLPDSPVLADFANELGRVEASRVPTCMRVAVSEMALSRKHMEAVTALAELQGKWETTPPEALVLRVTAARKVPAGRSTAPLGGPRPTLPPQKPAKVVKAKPVERRPRTPVAQIDERRVAWIEEEVLNRLEQYGVAGLKEAVLVAGARHRAPWKDVTEDEVLAVLRRLRRENRLRFSAGRWSTVSAR